MKALSLHVTKPISISGTAYGPTEHNASPYAQNQNIDLWSYFLRQCHKVDFQNDKILKQKLFILGLRDGTEGKTIA